MKENSKKESSKAAAAFLPAEGQSERWLKYGANVFLTIVVVVLLSGLMVYIAQRHHFRKDTTSGGTYSLKDQSRSLIKSLDSRTRLKLAQQIVQQDLPRITAKLDTMTDTAAEAAKPATTQPTTRLLPGAQALKDKLGTVSADTLKALDEENPDPSKVLKQLSRSLTDAASQAAGDASKSEPLKAAAESVKALVRKIDDFKPQIKLVGIFSRAKQEQERIVEGEDPEVKYQQVADLLQEYQQRSNGMISYEMIDNINQPSKVDALFNEVANKYGNDIIRYREVLDAYPHTLETINKLSQEELQALRKLTSLDSQSAQRLASEINMTVQLFPALLDAIRSGVKRQLDLKVPDYAGAAEAIRGPTGLGGLNEQVESILKRIAAAKDDPKTPEAFKQYISQAQPRFEAMKKAAGDLLAKMENLGSIRQTDELRENKANSIIVMAPNDIKAIPAGKVFQSVKSRMIESDNKVRPRFAGEQQVTRALWTLTGLKPTRIALVRAGGPPLAIRLPRYEGFLTAMSDELAEWNFEIVEKDVSGMWAMQAQQLAMQGMSIPPEPSDDQIKNIPWVVLGTAPEGQNPMMMAQMSGKLGQRVKEHLDAGGSAMILSDINGEKMDFLKDWGIEPKTSNIIIHEKIAPQGARANDPAMDWWRQQPIFVLDQYGQHPVTSPLRSLDGLFFAMIPVVTSEPKDKAIKVTPLLPIPNVPKPWGETDIEQIYQGKTATFVPTKDGQPNDMPPPLFAGAAAEKGKQRLITIGGYRFVLNDIVQMVDAEVARVQGYPAPRFPANGELFINSVFWLSQMDNMIGLSPSVFDVARVDPQMSDGAKTTWNIVLAGGLPVLVLFAGLFVWLKRRD